MNVSRFEQFFGEQSLRLYVNFFLILLLIDFVLGRILQRIYSPFATVGVVVATFANLLEYVVLVLLALQLYRKRGSPVAKIISIMVFIVAFLALTISYVTFLGAPSPPELSLMFFFVSLFIIVFAISQRMYSEKLVNSRRLIPYIAFSVLLLSYVFAYYNQIAVKLASHYLVVAPFYLEAFQMAQYLLLTAFFFVFIYSISVPCENFKMNLRIFSKTALIPTLILGPLLLATIFYFRVTQYLAMLMVEILGFAFSRVEIGFFILSVWFLFTGILILREKSRLSKARYLSRESIALAIFFLGGFIFGFVYYFLIGVIGALLLSLPIENTVNERKPTNYSPRKVAPFVPKEAENFSIITIASKQILNTFLSDKEPTSENV